MTVPISLCNGIFSLWNGDILPKSAEPELQSKILIYSSILIREQRLGVAWCFLQRSPPTSQDVLLRRRDLEAF